MTNGTIMSRRGCAERIEILPDGTIPPVEMTSLGFEKSLDPYKITPAEIACVLKGGAIVTEKNVFERAVTNICEGCVIGYKYFDFGEDLGSRTMELSVNVNGMGCDSIISVCIDGEEGRELGRLSIGRDSGVYTGRIDCITGRHSLFLKVLTDYPHDWTGESFRKRCLFELRSFVFMK